MSNSMQAKKAQRVEKELKLLRNLPKEYKIGKRDTSLGTLLYVLFILSLLQRYIVRNRQICHS